MLIPTIVMAVLAITLILIGYFNGQNQHISGLRSAWQMTISIIPMLVFAFIIAGMIQVLLPHAAVAKWVGEESGSRGLFIGTLAGAIAPGGPYVSLPIAAGLLQAGAGIGTMVAFLTGWSLWAISRLPMEIGILGWRLTLIRFACTFFFPPIAGFLAQTLFSNVK